MELVTGRAGSPHITAQQDRQLHQGIWGEGAYILNTGNMLEPVVQSSNKILIKDGALMYQGALFSVKVGTTDEITIDNGNQGMQRKDLVVARYTYDSEQNIESASWLVYKGTAVGSNPVLPSGISGDIQAGDNVVDVPYLAVTLNGINIVSVDVIPEVAPDIHTINTSLADLSDEVGKKEPTQKRVNFENRYYKNGYNCFLHANADDASDVIIKLSENYRPRSAAVVSGMCRNTSNNAYYPCVGVIGADGEWDYVSALENVGDTSVYYIYNPSQSIDRRSRFQVWLTGAWSTSTNGS
jgi:hypothetical protein